MENYNIFKIPYSPHFNMGELSSLYLLSMECKRSVEFSNWSFSMQRQLRIAGSYANTLVRNVDFLWSSDLQGAAVHAKVKFA